MKHLILSLLVLGFSQSLQAKLNINSPSGEKDKTHLVGEKNKDYSACANRVKNSRVKDFHVNKDVQQPNTPIVQAQDNKEFQRSVSATTNKPSSKDVSSHNNKDSQKESVTNSQVKTTFQKNSPAASVNPSQKQAARKPAQINPNALVCFTTTNLDSAQRNGTVIASIYCNGSIVATYSSRLGNNGPAESVSALMSASKAGKYLVEAGFIPAGCWRGRHNTEPEFRCIYYRLPQ